MFDLFFDCLFLFLNSEVVSGGRRCRGEASSPPVSIRRAALYDDMRDWATRKQGRLKERGEPFLWETEACVFVGLARRSEIGEAGFGSMPGLTPFLMTAPPSEW